LFASENCRGRAYLSIHLKNYTSEIDHLNSLPGKDGMSSRKPHTGGEPNSGSSVGEDNSKSRGRLITREGAIAVREEIEHISL